MKSGRNQFMMTVYCIFNKIILDPENTVSSMAAPAPKKFKTSNTNWVSINEDGSTVSIEPKQKPRILEPNIEQQTIYRDKSGIEQL